MVLLELKLAPEVKYYRDKEIDIHNLEKTMIMHSQFTWYSEGRVEEYSIRLQYERASLSNVQPTLVIGLVKSLR